MLSVRMSPEWRSAAGRFLRSPIDGAIEHMLDEAEYQGITLLRQANPVRTGLMRDSWGSRRTPRRLEIINTATYAGDVVMGTHRQQPNPALNRVIDTDIPAMVERVSGGRLKAAVDYLKG